MGDRIQSILMGLLFGMLGAVSCLEGLGLIDIGMQVVRGFSPVISGLMFLFAGALLFYRSILGPDAKGLPIYAWVNYLLILPILAGFGITMLFSGLQTGENMLALSAVLPLGATVWYAVAKFPGRKPKA